MKDKVIIDNRSDLDIEVALTIVNHFIYDRKLNAIPSYDIGDKSYFIRSRQNKESITFIVQNC